MVCLQPLWRNWPAKQSNSVRKRKKKAITPLKVIQVIDVGISRKPVCDFLLVINSNWHHISCRFGVIGACCSNFLTFCVIEPPFGGLETTYDVHLGLIGKRVADFLLVLIGLFSLGRTAEAIRTKIDRGHFCFTRYRHCDFRPENMTVCRRGGRGCQGTPSAEI